MYLIKGHEWVIKQSLENSDSFLLMNIESGDVYDINATSKFILDLCDGTKNESDIINTVLNVDRSHVSLEELCCESDVTEFITFLLEHSICFCCEKVSRTCHEGVEHRSTLDSFGK